MVVVLVVIQMQELQTCLQSRSTRLSFNPIVRKGHWQTAVVRAASSGQAMLIVVMHPQDLSAVSAEFSCTNSPLAMLPIVRYRMQVNWAIICNALLCVEVVQTELYMCVF